MTKKHTKIHKGKIPVALHDEVYTKLSAENWSYAKTSEWLLTEHQIETSPAAVHRLFARIREMRGEVTAEAYAKAVEEAAPEDMRILAESMRMLRELRSQKFEEGDHNAVVKLSLALEKHVALRANIFEASKKRGEATSTAENAEKIEEIENDLLSLQNKLEEQKKGAAQAKAEKAKVDDAVDPNNKAVN